MSMLRPTSSVAQPTSGPRSATPLHGPTPLYGLDIETDTSIGGLDPHDAAVVAVALSSIDGDEVLLGDECDVLAALDDRLAALPPGVIVTWNGRSFDLPFLAQRASVAGVELSLELWCSAAADGDAPMWPPPHGGFGATWGTHLHLDGYRLFCGDVRRTLGLSCGLKAMARLVGFDPIEVDYETMSQLSDAEMTDYVASDARLARELVARRLPAALSSVDRRRTGDRSPVAGAPQPVER